MRRAFVLTLNDDSDAASCQFRGHIEEVDTAREFRFRDTQALLAFLARCLAEAGQPDLQDGGDDERP
jgi:hypothetical protein